MFKIKDINSLMVAGGRGAGGWVKRRRDPEVQTGSYRTGMGTQGTAQPTVSNTVVTM